MICDRLKECVGSECKNVPLVGCVNRRELCIESSDTRSQVKCEENGKKYILVNTERKQVLSYKIDGGVVVTDRTVPEGVEKCDSLFVINGDLRSAILIELKGVNVRKALSQLRATLIRFCDFFETCRYVYARLIVTSSAPNLKTGPEYVNLMRLIAGKYHGNVKIKEKYFCEEDVDLKEDGD